MLLADDFCPAFDVHISCILTHYSLLLYAEFCMICWEQTAKRHKWPASPASTLISVRPLDKNLRKKRNIWGFDQRIATSSERLLVVVFNSILLCLSPFFSSALYLVSWWCMRWCSTVHIPCSHLFFTRYHPLHRGLSMFTLRAWLIPAILVAGYGKQKFPMTADLIRADQRSRDLILWLQLKFRFR